MAAAAILDYCSSPGILSRLAGVSERDTGKPEFQPPRHTIAAGWTAPLRSSYRAPVPRRILDDGIFHANGPIALIRAASRLRPLATTTGAGMVSGRYSMATA